MIQLQYKVQENLHLNFRGNRPVYMKCFGLFVEYMAKLKLQFIC